MMRTSFPRLRFAAASESATALAFRPTVRPPRTYTRPLIVLCPRFIGLADRYFSSFHTRSASALVNMVWPTFAQGEMRVRLFFEHRYLQRRPPPSNVAVDPQLGQFCGSTFIGFMGWLSVLVIGGKVDVLDGCVDVVSRHEVESPELLWREISSVEVLKTNRGKARDCFH